MDATYTAVLRRVPEGYIGCVEEVPGANTQGPGQPARGGALVLETQRELAEIAE